MWGEINNFVPDTNNVIDLSGIMEQARQKDCLAKYNMQSSIIDSREIVLPPMNSRLIYAAELHQCMKNMRQVMEEAELALKYNLTMKSEMAPILIPEEPSTRSVVSRKPLNFVDKTYSEFTMGFGKVPPTISELARKQIEKKIIATLFSHIGFLYTDNSVLEVLIDVFESFMKKLCTDLRNSNDSLLEDQQGGFADVLERVLIQNGLCGVQGLCDYYDKRIVRYEHSLKQKFKNVLSNYEKLLTPANMQVEVKDEKVEEIDSQDVPEVHFTAMDGEEGYLQPFLESGFQMLDSLEEGLN